MLYLIRMFELVGVIINFGLFFLGNFRIGVCLWFGKRIEGDLLLVLFNSKYFEMIINKNNEMDIGMNIFKCK